MDSIEQREFYDYTSTATATTAYDDECPPLGYPTGSNRTKGRDPFLNFLEGFSQVYLQGREVMERLFPGAWDELLEFFTKIMLCERVPRVRSMTMQRSLSAGSVSMNERFKVRGLDVGTVVQPDGDDKPVQGDVTK